MIITDIEDIIGTIMIAIMAVMIATIHGDTIDAADHIGVDHTGGNLLIFKKQKSG